MPLESTDDILLRCSIAVYRRWSYKEGKGTANGPCPSRVGTVRQRLIRRPRGELEDAGEGLIVCEENDVGWSQNVESRGKSGLGVKGDDATGEDTRVHNNSSDIIGDEGG